MNRMMLSLPVGLWALIVMSGCAGLQKCRPANRKLR